MDTITNWQKVSIDSLTMTYNPDKFRQTMRLWATGVTIVAAQYGAEMRGLTVSSFTSVTLEPPLVLVCVQKKTEAAQTILDAGAFSVSMLGQGHEWLSNLFAGLTPIPEGSNRFDGIPVIYAATGSPIIADAMGWLDCKLHDTYDGSTHYIFIGQVVEASGQPPDGVIKQPLLYYNREYHKFG